MIGDFCKGIPGLYENHPVKGAIGRYNEQDQEIHPKSMSQLKAELEDEKTSGAAMVELLSLYRDIYTDLDDSHELREQYEEIAWFLSLTESTSLEVLLWNCYGICLLRQILSGTLMQRTFLF